MGWIATAYHFVSSLVTCTIDHSAQIATTAIDLGKCVAGKFFH